MRSIGKVLGGTVATLSPAGAAIAGPGETSWTGGYGGGPAMMWGGTAWGGFGMILGPVFMILVVVAIVAAILFVLRGAGMMGTPPGARGDRALDLLKERFARGEIDAREYEERRRLLQD